MEKVTLRHWTLLSDIKSKTWSDLTVRDIWISSTWFTPTFKTHTCNGSWDIAIPRLKDVHVFSEIYLYDLWPTFPKSIRSFFFGDNNIASFELEAHTCSGSGDLVMSLIPVIFINLPLDDLWLLTYSTYPKIESYRLPISSMEKLIPLIALEILQ